MELRSRVADTGGAGQTRPQPLRFGVAVAVLGAVPLVAGLAGLIRPLSGFVFAAIFVAVGALRAGLSYKELVSLRREADRDLRRDGLTPVASLALVWRSQELTSARTRRKLARAVARLEREVSAATLPGASPLNRVAVRPHIDLVRRLSERLAALDQPVQARAVLQVTDLLMSADSPLYARERASELRDSLRDCLQALNGGR